ncbi:sigma 54-interacting transcriptional regulator [Desulfobulbus alkaliphilus]|uniref:sigma 54-interacting transcriptional regulator n=1 Tax=Desulfobulbus alkaliphilus TaxID=869814 RepID=UPI0019650426|nr:sigma 54-interacting transcriptional regulator [Desulfobulbus alkaliphilus]MBM9536607.1 sigma 54-interacting transcriptional regulator [Desulfobulbus alkaliphilus]
MAAESLRIPFTSRPSGRSLTDPGTIFPLPPPATVMPQLIICQDAQNYRLIEFAHSLTIGREPGCDVLLDSPQVSRQHAAIRRSADGEYMLQDLGSTNAVWMEKKKIDAVPLSHGQTFRIVNFSFTFLVHQDQQAPLPVLATPHHCTQSEPAVVESATLFFPHEIPPPRAVQPEDTSPSEFETNLLRLCTFFHQLRQADNEQALCEQLLTGSLELIPAQGGFLALLDEKQQLLYATTAHFDPEKEHQAIRQDIVRRVMIEGCSAMGDQEDQHKRSSRATRRSTSVICSPLLQHGGTNGCLYLDHHQPEIFSQIHLSMLELISLQGAALLDTLVTRTRISSDRQSLTARLATKDETIIRSEKMLRLYEDIRTIAPINVPVFISGEPGSGKEHVAAALHSFSKRKGAYVPLNCAAIPEGLFESELFGSRKGAFHEAIDKPGKLELAHGGTLFLDEVADMTLTLQPKLLRFLENGESTRLGDNTVKKLDVRVITATNRNVAAMIDASEFRDDLYQRLSCFTLIVPPLRDRREDIEPLTRYFLKKFSHEYNWQESPCTDGAMQLLHQYHWPGNIRQLRNVLLRLAVHTQGKAITEKDIRTLSDEFATSASPRLDMFPTLDDVEEKHIRFALRQTAGNISDAAALVGIARSTLYQKIKKYNILLDP